MKSVSLAVLLLLLGAFVAMGCRAAERREARQDATATSIASNVEPGASTGSRPTSASLSAGCGATVKTGLTVAQIESDGVARSYRLYVPGGYNAQTPAPLVLNYHGFGSNAVEQERYSGLTEVADKEGFVLVTPDGTNSPQRWYIYGQLEPGYVDDFAFTNRLLDHLIATLCIDKSRIYATGISNGGGTASLVGCRLNERIAAVAPVAGAPFSNATCRGREPMPVIAFHGTDDELVPFEGGLGGRLNLLVTSVRTNMREWAEHNGCNMTLQSERIAPDVVLESYRACKGGAEVLLYVVEGGGHTWPGSSRNINFLGATTQSIRASELMWGFFEQHTR